MKLPDLFGREKRSARETQLAAQDRAERLLAEGFRFLSTLFTKVAERIDTQRLQRRGYGTQGKWLERLDRRDGTSTPRQ